MQHIVKSVVFVWFWALAMAWHLYRILLGRPAYENLSDSRGTVVSFILAFFAAGVFRHCVMEPIPDPFFAVVAMLMLHLILVLALFERSGRSSSLVAAILGTSVVVDLFVSAAMPFGLDGAHWGLFGIEIALGVLAVLEFHRQPEAVRRAGYKRRTAAA